MTLAAQTATSDSAGNFSFTFSNAQQFPMPIKVEAPGYLVRETSFRDNATLDLISLAPPFSLTLFNELVRGTVDQNGPNPLMRWTTPPSIGINLMTEDGKPVDPAMLDIVEQAIRDSFSLWTGAALNYRALERRSITEGQGGWITVHFFERGQVCANAGNWPAVANPHQIASSKVTFYLRECACGSRRIQASVVAHELGHAMGFEHVRDDDLTMYPYADRPCAKSGGPLVTPIEQHHAAISYRRPPGNVAPDKDQ